MLTQKELDQIKSRLKSLPDLPWGYYPRGNRDNSSITYDVVGHSGQSVHEVTIKESDYPEDWRTYDDKAAVVAEFIWKAPEMIQLLLDHIEEMKKEKDNEH